MKRILVFLSLTVLFDVAHAQDTSKPRIGQAAHLQDDGQQINERDTFLYSHNIIVIRLTTGFNDSVRLWINDTLILDTVAVTNESIEVALEFGIHFDHLADRKKLRLLLGNKGEYLTEMVNLHYPLLQIGIDKERGWALTYAKHFPMLE